MKDNVSVAKGVSVKRGEQSKMRKKQGSSNAGKYKDVSPEEFAGESGGADKFSFPINSIARARNALARAHYAPRPEGIRAAVYKKYPELKNRHEDREDGKKDPSKKKEHPHEKSPAKVNGKAKIKKVMHEYKHDELHSGSKKGPLVKNKRQAIAIALSEAKKSNKK